MTIQAAATKLSSLNEAQHGDRKSARDFNKRGLDEFKNKNIDAAINLLSKAAAIDPADVEIVSNLAYVAVQGNKLPEAEKSLYSALILDPRRTSTWFALAEFMAVKNNLDAALRATLIGYEFSTNREKTKIYLTEQSTAAKNETLRRVYEKSLRIVSTR